MIDGKKIYFYRIKKGLTQKAASEGICSVSYLSKIENNSITASPEILQLLCDRMDIEYSNVSEESINQMRKELFDWYQDIKYKSRESADQKYTCFKSSFSKVDDPEIVHLYQAMCARYYLYIEDLDAAEELLNELNEIKKTYSSQIKFYIFQFTGLLEYMQDRFKSSLDYYIKAYKLYPKLDLQEQELLYQLANLNARLGYFSQSLYYAKIALEEFNAEANYSRSLDCHIMLGISYSRLKDYSAAMYHYELAMNAAKANPSLKEIIPGIMHNMGHCYFQMGEYEKALTVLNECLVLKKGKHADITISLIAHTYLNKNEFKEALKWVKKGMKMIGDSAINVNYIRMKILQFRLENKARTEEAQHFLEKEALPFLEKTKDRLNLIEVYDELAAFYTDKFSYKQANYYFAKVNALYKENL